MAVRHYCSESPTHGSDKSHTRAPMKKSILPDTLTMKHVQQFHDGPGITNALYWRRIARSLTTKSLSNSTDLVGVSEHILQCVPRHHSLSSQRSPKRFFRNCTVNTKTTTSPNPNFLLSFASSPEGYGDTVAQVPDPPQSNKLDSSASGASAFACAANTSPATYEVVQHVTDATIADNMILSTCTSL